MSKVPSRYASVPLSDLPNTSVDIYENRLQRWWPTFLLGSSSRIFPRFSKPPWRISPTSSRKEPLWISRLMSWSSLSRLCFRIHRVGRRPYKNYKVGKLSEVVGRIIRGLTSDIAALIMHSDYFLPLTLWYDNIIHVPLFNPVVTHGLLTSVWSRTPVGVLVMS